MIRDIPEVIFVVLASAAGFFVDILQVTSPLSLSLVLRNLGVPPDLIIIAVGVAYVLVARWVWCAIEKLWSR